MQDNKSNFNIDEFINCSQEQVATLLPEDIGNKTQTFIEEMFDKFLRMANEAIDNNYSDLEFKNEDKVLLLQVIAEWTFHKTIDMDRAKIPFEYWESILQKIAFVVFDVFEKGISANHKQQVILMGIEYHINQMYNSSLQELFEKGHITKEVLEKAQKESNLDKMFAEWQQKNSESEKESKKESDKNDSQKTELSSQISDMCETCKSKASYFIIAGAAVTILICILCFGESIWTVIEEHQSVIISIVAGIILLSAIAGVVIYFAVQKDIKEQLKKLDEVKQEMQDLVNPDK